jgi:hypothetical protein
MLDAAALSTVTPERMDTARLDLHPACSLFVSEWDIVGLWQAHQPESGREFPTELARASHALIVRPHWKAEVLALPAAGHMMLSYLAAGQTLGEALDTALEVDGQFDFGVHLQQWLRAGVFTSLDLN